MKIGFVVNPLAGIGGSVALKGSDGEDVVNEAMSRGAIPLAGVRALAALKEIRAADIPPGISFLTAGGDMGESILAQLELDSPGLSCEVVYSYPTPAE